MKKRSGEYFKQILGQVFTKDEYNDPTLDQYVKHEYIKKAHTAAKSAAKADLLFNSDDSSEDFIEYPEYIVDDEEMEITVGALGAYDKSLDLRNRIQSEIRSNLLNEIRTKQQGQPLSQAEDQYFQTIEE